MKLFHVKHFKFIEGYSKIASKKDIYLEKRLTILLKTYIPMFSIRNSQHPVLVG